MKSVKLIAKEEAPLNEAVNPQKAADFMMLEEANARLKKCQINEEQLWDLNPLYLVLDLDKDVFCKIVDLVGLETLIEKKGYYERLYIAERRLKSSEDYLVAKDKLERLETEIKVTKDLIRAYDSIYLSKTQPAF